MSAGNFNLRKFGKSLLPGMRGQNNDPWAGAVNIWVDCRCYINSFDGNVYDVTQDIIRGSLIRAKNNPTTMSITVANQSDKYRGKFIPLDRVVLFLRRGNLEWQSFTGYVRGTPIYNLVTHQEITIEFEDIIRRLKQKFWDPNLPENAFALGSGVGQTSEGGLATPETMREENPDNAQAGLQGYVSPDQILAFILTAPDHVGLDPSMVFIQQFPSEWAQRAAAINGATSGCKLPWEELIRCPGENEPGAQDDSGYGGPAEGYPGEGSADPEVACWMADQAEKRGIPGELPVMTALVESGLQNLPYGDRDSAGYFQQRPSQGWGSYEQVTDPNYSLGKFLDVAEQIHNQFPERDCATLGAWAQAVQRSAFPERYAQECERAKALIGDCGGGEQSAPNIVGDSRFAPARTPVGSGRGGFSGISSFGVENGNILAPYGAGNHPITGTHFGVDVHSGNGGRPSGQISGPDTNFAGPTPASADRYIGPRIYAVADGRVVSGPFNGMGCGDSTFIIKYENGPMTLYCHNARAAVKQGEIVKKGDLIGYIGCEGNCARTSPDWPHLHIQTVFSENPNDVFLIEKAVDPAIALGIDDDGSQSMFLEQKRRDPLSSPNKAGVRGRDGKVRGTVIIVGGQNPIDRASRESQQSNPLLDDFIKTLKLFVGSPYRWGGGHNISEDIDFFEAKRRGVDTSGLFNNVRAIHGLSPIDVGATSHYLNFLDDVKPFDRFQLYKPGTILLNPGSQDTIGHMAMVTDFEGHVIEANGGHGQVIDHYTIQESDQGWEGYTHVGTLPDVGSLFPAEDTEGGIIAASPNDGLLSDFIETCKSMAGPPYNYGGGHNGETLEQAQASGVDCSGLFNVAFDHLGIAGPPGYGGTPAYYQTISNAEAYDPSKTYPVGTFLVNTDVGPGYDNSHVAMIIDQNQTLIHSIRPGGVTWGDTAPDADIWANFQAAGHMTTLGTSNLPPSQGEIRPSGIQTDNEPCIMKNPLGVYRLNGMTQNTANSIWIRHLSLNGVPPAPGDYNALFSTHLGYPQEVWKIHEGITEQRDWTLLAEVTKEPYIKTVLDIARSGMYEMQTIGTGEIVFWYPMFLEPLAPNLLPVSNTNMSPDELGARIDALRQQLAAAQTAQEKEEIQRDIDDLINTYNPMTPQDQQQLTDQITNGQDISGQAMNSANASVLTRTMILKDTELVDFTLRISDDNLVTHYYIMPDSNFSGESQKHNIFAGCWRWSTIFDNPLFVMFREKGLDWDPNAFIQRYGSRPKKEEVPSVKTSGFAQIWADHEFIKYWLQCYTIGLKTMFLPELYAGQRLLIESLGVEVIVLQATHNFGDIWSTELVTSMPLAVTDQHKVPPLPFWSLINKNNIDLDPRNRPPGEGPGGADIGNTGDPNADIEAKRARDRAMTEQYLRDWATVQQMDQAGLVDRRLWDELIRNNWGAPEQRQGR